MIRTLCSSISQSVLLSLINPFNNCIIVLLLRSTKPLEEGLYGVEYTWFILNSLSKLLNSSDLNSEPLSDKILVGIIGRLGRMLFLNALDTT